MFGAESATLTTQPAMPSDGDRDHATRCTNAITQQDPFEGCPRLRRRRRCRSRRLIRSGDAVRLPCHRAQCKRLQRSVRCSGRAPPIVTGSLHDRRRRRSCCSTRSGRSSRSSRPHRSLRAELASAVRRSRSAKRRRLGDRRRDRLLPRPPRTRAGTAPRWRRCAAAAPRSCATRCPPADARRADPTASAHRGAARLAALRGLPRCAPRAAERTRAAARGSSSSATGTSRCTGCSSGALAPLLDAILTSAEAGARKPEAAIFEHALSACRGRPRSDAPRRRQPRRGRGRGARGRGSRAVLISRGGGRSPPGVQTMRSLAGLTLRSP